MRKENITFRCKEELKEDLEELASKELKDGQKPNLSEYLNVVLTDHVNKENNKE